MKAIEQCLQMVLFIILHNVVLLFVIHIYLKDTEHY